MFLELSALSLLLCFLLASALESQTGLAGRRLAALTRLGWFFFTPVSSAVVALVVGHLGFQRFGTTFFSLFSQRGLGIEFPSLSQPTLWVAWQYGTLLAALLPVLTFFVLTLTRPTVRVGSSLLGLGFMVIVGLFFIFAESFFMLVLAFELLLLVSLYLLRLTSKSERIFDATVDMFFWTLAGSLGLILGLLLLQVGGHTSFFSTYTGAGLPSIVATLFVFGFGVKLPIWPCFSWLLKAHVEASVEFSILLSGVVVKFGALGLYRVLSLEAGFGAATFLLGCSMVAIFEATFRLLAQRDLKRIVALTTVIEVNWVGLCLGFGGLQLELVGAFILVAHSFTTTAEFGLVECLYRRYRTRDILGLTGLAAQTPLLHGLCFLNVLTTIGFPGTSLFAGKVLFFSSLAQYSLLLLTLLAFYFILCLPLIFFRVWVPIWYGQFIPTFPLTDLSSVEASLLLLPFIAGVCLGVFPFFVIF